MTQAPTDQQRLPTDQQRFGPFIIGEKIGSGGMAVVYKALNTETKRRVALKVLRSMVAENPAAVERFQQEATIATRLKHPHVVQIHSHGQLRGRHYLEMQFMAGGTLQQRLQNPTELSGKIPPNSVYRKPSDYYGMWPQRWITLTARG